MMPKALTGLAGLASPRRPPAAPAYSPEILWQIALGELQLQMTKATFNAWLLGSRAIPEASGPAFLTVSVRNQYAREWLTHRLQPLIARTLAGVAGYEVDVNFISKERELCEGVAMNPLEERLQQYLAQFDEPERGDSLRGNASLPQGLIQSRILPIGAVELPVSATSDLFKTLLSQGENAMSDYAPSSPTRVRIYSHITQSRFLHVEDALGLGSGKLRLFAGTYSRGRGMSTHAIHFLDLADARVIFGALARGDQGFSHKEYKGTPPQTGHLDKPGAGSEQGRRDGNGAVSRVLSIAVKGENVYIELRSGPGKMTNTGAITPNGRAKVEVNVGFKLYEARRMAASVLAYIHAWDVMRMMVNQQMVSQPPPYLLVPATSATNGIQSAPANGASKSNDVIRPPVVAANGRPVTRKDPNGAATRQAHGRAVKLAPLASSQPAKTDTTASDDQLLKYGDGLTVDGTNLTEAQTFRQYVAEKKTAPESKAVLLDYYRQRAQVPAGVAGP
jgi:hypothetical protein